MYVCTDCGRNFEEFSVVFEEHGLDTAPFEAVAVCPFCKSNNISEVTLRRCHYCGVRLYDQKDFCSSACRENGLKLWQLEQHRRRRRAVHPLNVIIREVENYNRRNGTCYTYGQYISRILPTLSKNERSIYES